MVDILKEVISTDILINHASLQNTIIIKEDSTLSKVKKLTITNLPSEIFAFTLDYQPYKVIRNNKFKSKGVSVNKKGEAQVHFKALL